MAHTYRILSRLVIRSSRLLDWPLFSLSNSLTYATYSANANRWAQAQHSFNTCFKATAALCPSQSAFLRPSLPKDIYYEGLEDVFIGLPRLPVLLFE